MPADPSPSPANDSAAELARRYDTIAYAAQAQAQTHPAHLAMVATLLGRAPPPVATCTVLEIGCADGTNLLPMAVALPDAHFTGCDLSGQSIAAATRAVAELGLRNVTLVQQDLRTLVDAPGTYDYIIAHGVYSWVPEPVREALLALAARRLSPQGVMFVSFNTFPGCHVRQAIWEILHAHVDALPNPADRLDAARTLAALLAEPGRTQSETDELLRQEFGKIAEKSDSALFHDDLAMTNQPFHFREFTGAISRHGLAFVAEAKLSMMTPAGLSPRIAQWVEGMDLLTREQYLDYARLRRFRQSIIGHANAPLKSTSIDERLAGMHAAASIALVRAVAEGNAFGGDPAAASRDARAMRELLEWLVAASPRSVAMNEATAWHAHNSPGATRSAAAILVDACFAEMVDLHVHPPQLAATASARPEAGAVVRWQIARQPMVTNLRHETLRIDDPLARSLLAALDGTRTHEHLNAFMAAALPPAERASAPARVATYLSNFALHGLLRA